MAAIAEREVVDGGSAAMVLAMVGSFYDFKETHDPQVLKKAIADLDGKVAGLPAGRIQRSLGAVRGMLTRLLELAGEENLALMGLVQLGNEAVRSFAEASDFASTEYRNGSHGVENSVAMLLLLLLGLPIVIAQVISRSIIKNITASRESIENCAGGYFNVEFTAELLAQRDEFGQIARSIRTMTENVRATVENVLRG